MEVSRNQAHPQNLAAVRKSGTPVFAKPEPGATELFCTEAEHEFELLGIQGSWVRYRLVLPIST